MRKDGKKEGSCRRQLKEGSWKKKGSSRKDIEGRKEGKKEGRKEGR